VVFDRRAVAFERGGYLPHIARGDVALVRARMDGDSLRAGLEARVHGVHHTGHAPTARIAQRRDLVDVDREADHPTCFSPTSQISRAQREISSASCPSSMTRSSGSVPE